MIKKYIWQILLIIAIGIIFLQRSCCNEIVNTPVTIITPEKKGSFENIKPVEIIKKEKYPVYINGDTVYLDNPVDSTLANNYKKERDSIQRELMYYKAIQKRDYLHKFEDKNLIINVKAKTTGTLDSLGIDYKTKSDTLNAEVSKPKETNVAVYLGGGVYTNDLKPSLKINLGLQNKKGDIYRGSYDPINKNYFIEYDLRIFNYKK